jgi:hypothetical protein
MLAINFRLAPTVTSSSLPATNSDALTSKMKDFPGSRELGLENLVVVWVVEGEHELGVRTQSLSLDGERSLYCCHLFVCLLVWGYKTAFPSSNNNAGASH